MPIRRLLRQLAFLGLLILGAGTLTGGQWRLPIASASARPGNVSAQADTPTTTATATATATITATVTVTGTATPTAIQQPTSLPGPGTAPTISFSADKTSIGLNGCAVLTWVIWDATQSMLNGAPVSGQDRLEVCPTSTQRYTLTASNAAGQAMREIVIQVTGSGRNESPLPAPAVSPFPTRVLAEWTPPSQTPPVGQPFSAAQQTPAPTLPVQPTQWNRVDQAAVAAQPTSEPTVDATPTPTVYYTFVAPPTSTSRPRQALDTDGPTPTPMLLARAAPAPPPASGDDPASSAGAPESSGGPPKLAVESREFDPDLLPGYAMYLLATASLLAAGVWVVRRKGSPGPDR